MSRKDLSFAEYMADLGVGDHTKLFDKRGEDGEFNDDDIAKILSKGYTDKQTERLINKYTNEFLIDTSSTGSSNPGSTQPNIGPGVEGIGQVGNGSSVFDFSGSNFPGPRESNFPGPLPPEGFEAPEPIDPGYTFGNNPIPEPEPEPTPEPTPEPEPEPTPEPVVPEPGYGADDVAAAIAEALAPLSAQNDSFEEFMANFEVPTIDYGAITDSFNQQLGGLQSSYENQIAGIQSNFEAMSGQYSDQIAGLRDTMSGYQNQMLGYEGQISSMADQLREAEERARQVKVTDTQYISDNTASGVRLNRSDNYNRGSFSMGAGQLNRNNRAFSINNINL